MNKYNLVLFLLCFTSVIYGQYNLKVGYNLGYNTSSDHNKIIQAYNAANPFFEDELGELRFMNGITIGARYTFGNVALEIAFDNLSSSKSASGYDPVNDVVVEQDLKYRMREFSVNLQNRFEWFGYGAGIGRRNFQLKSDIPSENFEVTNVNISDYTYQLFLLFDLPSSKNLTFTLKPYVIIPFNSTEIGVLNDVLNVNTGITEDTFKTFGLSFIFYNGPNSNY